MKLTLSFRVAEWAPSHREREGPPTQIDRKNRPRVKNGKREMRYFPPCATKRKKDVNKAAGTTAASTVLSLCVEYTERFDAR